MCDLKTKISKQLKILIITEHFLPQRCSCIQREYLLTLRREKIRLLTANTKSKRFSSKSVHRHRKNQCRSETPPVDKLATERLCYFALTCRWIVIMNCTAHRQSVSLLCFFLGRIHPLVAFLIAPADVRQKKRDWRETDRTVSSSPFHQKFERSAR